MSSRLIMTRFNKEVTVKKSRPPSKGRFIGVWGTSIGLMLVVTVVINAILFGQLRTVMDNQFRPGVERSDALTTASANLTEEIESEGIVLLKNNGTLPLTGDALKVNVFGWSSVSPVYGGTGSGAVDPSTAVSFLDGLTAAGIEHNPRLPEFYQEFRDERPAIEIRAQDWTVPEPSMSEYDDAGVFENATAFSDTAIVMVSRSGGEGADLARDLGGSADSIQLQTLRDGREMNVGAVGSDYEDDIDADKHYLELSNRETAMVERVSTEFANVIVLVNTGNVFELGWVDEYDVDSVAWIGGPGETGFAAVGKMLTGEVNPSGATVDTWARDLLAGPSMASFGGYSYTDSEDVDSGDVPIAFSGDPATRPGYQFLNYVEGIYVGYRFYETFYLDDADGYNAAVQYPFGHGLSYSTFEQTMSDPVVTEDAITVEVTVKNTGEVAGKDIVQLYSTPPYVNGGIEKAAVNLVAFEKTAVIEPGQSATVTLNFALEDLASFDQVDAGAWVLEAGEYRLGLGSNSHEMIDSRSYTVAETIIYDGDNKRSSDEVAATPQFAGIEGETITLSRADGFANFEQAITPAQDRAMTAAEEASMRVDLSGDSSTKMPTTGADNGLTLEDMPGLDYDDPTWDKLLDQMTIDDMVNVVSLGGYQTKPADSVGKPGTIDIDGPQGLASFMGASVRAGAYPTAMVIASTWNVDLAKARGQMVGYEALELGVSGWYAPGMNMHRNPFAGRNFEYYSEDPVLSADIAAAEVGGAQGEGLYVYIKHFVLNDQETYRNSRLLTWVDEQTLREIYLRPFEASVKEGNATAIMSAYNYINGVWAGGSSALLETVLREEWGFQGMVITDYFGDYGYLSGDQAIANGNDMMLSTLGMFGATPEKRDAQGVADLRQANKNILYTIANSNAMYTDAERTEMLVDVGGHISELGGFHKLANDLGLESWELFAYIANAVIGALLLTLAFCKVRKFRRIFSVTSVKKDSDAESTSTPQ